MLGCYFIATGSDMGLDFDVESFLATSSLVADYIYHRGERSGHKNQPFDSSGFSVTISETGFGHLNLQIPAALDFLRDKEEELERLMRFPGLKDMRVVFTYCPGNAAMRSEYFSPELLRTAGSLSIGIALSVYPGEEVGET